MTSGYLCKAICIITTSSFFTSTMEIFFSELLTENGAVYFY